MRLNTVAAVWSFASFAVGPSAAIDLSDAITLIDTIDSRVIGKTTVLGKTIRVFIAVPPPDGKGALTDEHAVFKDRSRDHKLLPPPDNHKEPKLDHKPNLPLLDPKKEPPHLPNGKEQRPQQHANNGPKQQHQPNVIPNLPKGDNKPKSPNKDKDGDKSKTPNKEKDAQCTQQEISCNFVREAAYQMQNDDDECLKLATSFDDQGKIHFEPIAQDNENVIYGLTTDGLTASAWCNDVGWALRKIYINCRRGNKCYGGSTYAARNSVFLVTVGPRVSSSLDKPKIAVQSPSS